MITVKKLLTLKTGTRQRKIVSLLKLFELNSLRGESPDMAYLVEISRAAGNLESLTPDEKESITGLVKWLESDNDVPSGSADIARFCNSVRHILLKNMNSEPAEWDLVVPGDRIREPGERSVREFYLYLDDIRSPFNIGSIFRTAESFGIKRIYLSKDSASPEHRRAERSSMGTVSIVPWQTAGPYGLPDLPLFALELGGTPLDSFNFPERGIMVIGSEELGVSPALLDRADKSMGRVSIPLGGVKGSLNVSVAAGIVLQKWFSYGYK